jgi:hypothetical protein
MLTALAPSGPVAPAVPISPPSTTDTTQPVQRESFRDVYGSVSSGDDSKSDAGSKQKATDSTDAKPKKSSTDEGNDKTAVAVTPSPHGLVLQKAPLAFMFPSLTQDASQPGTDESAGSTLDNPQSSGGAASQTDTPHLFETPVQGAATTLVAADQELAFSARLTQPDALPSAVQTPKLSVPQPSRVPANSEPRTTVGPTTASAGKDAYQTVDLKKAAAPVAVQPAREIAATSAFDLRQTTSQSQPAEPLNATPSRSLTIQDVQPILPEIPKPPASTEILLQLAGKDQSTASVRVVDRSGTVNVTVHAADADLRNSLRSNLSDLASQLTGQGFKTEMAKPVVIAANAENQHDSRHSGQDTPSQQQNDFAQDGRQPQRDNRANSDRWRDELEQETSGTPGTAGGKS